VIGGSGGLRRDKDVLELNSIHKALSKRIIE
jgi:hypothetical protein